MPNVSFYGLLIVAVFAFAAPLLLGLSPACRLPYRVYHGMDFGSDDGLKLFAFSCPM
jgi:hypothetical protein